MKNRKIIEAVAKMYGVSPQEVRNEINNAIHEAYQTPTDAANAVKRKQAIPPIDEFLSHIVCTIQLNQTNR